MNFLAWLFPTPLDPTVTAATRTWLHTQDEARAERSAREQLVEWKVREAAARHQLRERNRMYGRASQTVGEQRGVIARLRAERDAWCASHEDQAIELRDVRQGAFVEQRDRATAIEGAAITLRAHVFDWSSKCECGWRPTETTADHSLHVAEQLAAVGALGNVQLSVESSVASSPVLVDRDGDEWLPRPGGSYYCPAGDISRTSRDELDASYGPLSEKAATS
ncbi:hypothetical protein [Pseudonocardia broussonetiae]|uniref:Uncharacterized protein n=1 Tax=Pseudonocardia broussonetiae TaxID=2736640 RepID=A0A6M6JJ82_9PSEU|nr:hypothetical protein [Pseudonocardia broussonetiae]QJY46692.1 hypothetical protein HOP40_13390 [Pseudonocardia broussonetiae]